jgi:fluoroquinolone transport system permease protein
MIGTVIKNEARTITRDPMYLFFGFYTIILGVIGYYLVPWMEDNPSVPTPWPQVVAMFFIVMTGFIFGAITAFTLLDDKDDNVLMSLKITPISVKAYVYVKLIATYLFGLVATIVLILATGFLQGSSAFAIIAISLVSALQAPGLTLIVNSFAQNKVEGFVYMKMSGLILILPVLAFFYQAWQEVFFVIAPGFWSARMIQMELLPNIETNFTFIVYTIVGVIYNLLFVYLFMQFYAKKSNL